MIKKRQVKQSEPDNKNNVQNQQQTKHVVEQNNVVRQVTPFKREKEDVADILKHQPKNIDPTRHKDFATYKEEACYVLDLLESKGVDIYEEGRTGGMYLKQRGSARFGNVFNKNNDKSNEIDNNKLDSGSLASIFGKK